VYLSSVLQEARVDVPHALVRANPLAMPVAGDDTGLDANQADRKGVECGLRRAAEAQPREIADLPSVRGPAAGR